MMAKADAPSLRPRFSMAPLVTTETIGAPPARVSCTSELTAPLVILLTVPCKTLRALSFMDILLVGLKRLAASLVPSGTSTAPPGARRTAEAHVSIAVTPRPVLGVFIAQATALLIQKHQM